MLNIMSDFCDQTFKGFQEYYVPPGLTFKTSTLLLHSVYVFSEQTATFALYNVNSLVIIAEVESVYSAIRTESLYNTYVSSLKG